MDTPDLLDIDWTEQWTLAAWEHPTLSHDVHPIFTNFPEDKFDFDSLIPLCPALKPERVKYCYSSLLPALRLATLFIEHSLPYFHVIFFSKARELTWLEEEGIQYVKLSELDEPKKKLTDAEKKQTRQALLDMATGITWDANDNNPDSNAACQLNANYPTFPYGHSRIDIAIQMIQHLETSHSVVDRLPERLGNSFSLAVTLTHELMHAACFAARSHEEYPESFYIGNAYTTELGGLWEQRMFGGIVSLRSWDENRKYKPTAFVEDINNASYAASYTWKWGVEAFRGHRPAVWTRWAVSGSYISRLFQQAYWDSLGPYVPLGTLHPVHTAGKRSYHDTRTGDEGPYGGNDRQGVPDGYDVDGSHVMCRTMYPNVRLTSSPKDLLRRGLSVFRKRDAR